MTTTGALAEAVVVPAMVGRPALERRLDRLPPSGVALVVAPAGSGKSVLVRQWVERLG